MTTTAPARLALVTGATGYVGGEVTAELVRRGWRVRVLTRSAAKLADVAWADAVDEVADGEQPAAPEPGRVQPVEGDADDAAVLARAMHGVDVAWYLLHSMGEGDDFAEREVAMAELFGGAAQEAGVARIVYLGGLHPDGEKLSVHLRSRVDVGDALMASGVPTAALQAGVVLGDGSISFEMLRHLGERLPISAGPSWLRNRIQPIAIGDAVHYLVAAADLGPEHNRTFDIGGPEALPYGDMLGRYARAVGLPGRPTATAPLATPRLAARWISLVTPVKADVATPLIGSLLHDTVVGERDLDALVGPPPGGHTGFDDAVRRAVRGLDTRRWRRTLLATSAAVTAAAVVGSLATKPDAAWFAALDKPRWYPPAAAFPLVWTALYADIAVVGALAHADLVEAGDVDEAAGFARAYGLNLALNGLWPATFFRAGNLPLATGWAGALALSSADLVRRVRRGGPERAVALAPYAAWTAFATVLAGELARRNR